MRGRVEERPARGAHCSAQRPECCVDGARARPGRAHRSHAAPRGAVSSACLAMGSGGCGGGGSRSSAPEAASPGASGLQGIACGAGPTSHAASKLPGATTCVCKGRGRGHLRLCRSADIAGMLPCQASGPQGKSWRSIGGAEPGSGAKVGAGAATNQILRNRARGSDSGEAWRWSWRCTWRCTGTALELHTRTVLGRCARTRVVLYRCTPNKELVRHESCTSAVPLHRYTVRIQALGGPLLEARAPNRRAPSLPTGRATPRSTSSGCPMQLAPTLLPKIEGAASRGGGAGPIGESRASVLKRFTTERRPN